MKEKLTPEDILLWQSHVKDVKPLSKIKPKPKKTGGDQTSQPPRIQVRVLEKKARKIISLLPLQPLGRKELRHVKVGAQLDLHGMTLEQGYDALERFLRQAQDRGLKTVLIITGKGAVNNENTMRHQLPRWLQETPLRSLISSFHYPAQPRDGGHGAFYVGIRKFSHGK